MLKYISFTFLFSFFLLVGKTQTAFIENKGQWNESILYKAPFAAGNLYLENNALNYNFYDQEKLHDLVSAHHQVSYPYYKEADWGIKGHCLKMVLEDAYFDVKKVHQKKQSSTYYNFYLGKDKSSWKSKVYAFQELHFEDVYPQIDFTISYSNNSFKYEFELAPNTDAQQISIEYQGAESLHIEQGHLMVKTPINELIEQKPYAYQIINGEKIEVACKFKINGSKVSFDFPNSYQKNYAVIIDPFIVFSRYSSSFANNFGYTATFDSKGNAYGAGSVFNVGYITTPGAFDVSFNGLSSDIGITKYTPDGLQRLYATYLGGDGTELPHSIIVNSRDELFVLGTTSSSDFPTSASCFDSTFAGGTLSNLSQGLGVIYSNGSDFIVSRFSEDGTALLASTYVGGSANDGLNLSPVLKYNYADEVRGEILMDNNDNCLITSCTYSIDFPVLNSIDSTHNGNLDAVVFKLDENLSNLQWSTFIGGALDDGAYSISLDDNEDIFIAGGTQSVDFPTVNAFQTSYSGGRADGFITRLQNTGSNLISSTYYGSSDYDQIYFIDNNINNEVHIFGQSNDNTNAFIENAIYNNPNGGQILTKFNHNVDTIIWSTRFGDGAGIPDISPTAFIVDVCNQILLSGWGSPNLGGNINLSGTAGLDITTDADDSTTDNRDFYFMMLRDDASSLIYASYFGGNQSAEHVDGGTSRFDKKGMIYQAVCAGCGGNQDFPTIPIDSASFWRNNNSCNLGLVKYAFTPPSVIAEFILPDVDCVPQDLFFENTSQTAFNDTSQSTFIWQVNDSTIESYHLEYNFTEAGQYTIQLLAIDSVSCNFADSVTKEITIIGNSSQTLDTITTCKNNVVSIGINPINNANIIYNWTPTIGLSNPTVANPSLSADSNITYTLTVSNNNCIDTFTQRIEIQELEINLTHRDSICLNDTVQVNALPNISNAFYEWQPSNLLQTNQGNSSATFQAVPPLNVTCIVTDPLGCKDTATTSIFVIENLPDINATVTPDTIELGDTSQLEAFSIVSNEYSWDEDTTLSEENISNPLAFPTATTSYTVNVWDANCSNKAEVTVYVKLPECIEDKLFVPNAFTPNNDGNNDVFYVRSIAPIEQFYFTIYDRWGQQVFESYDINIGWDGTFKGKALSPAAFAWYCSGFCEEGEEFLIKGNVSIIK